MGGLGLLLELVGWGLDYVMGGWGFVFLTWAG
jgi:hypothetical protein